MVCWTGSRPDGTTSTRAVSPTCSCTVTFTAASLLEPIGALRRALIYQRFLDAIEPDERIYHAPDPADWLEQAAVLSRA